MRLHKDAKATLIRSLPLFADCTAAEVAEVAAIADEIDLSAGRRLTTEHAEGQEFVVFIDGHAQIYRAYFAPFRDLTSPTGEPTKATFVFTQMLLNLVSQRKPDYLCMVVDSGDEIVFRKEIFQEYKSNRQSPPDDFYPQEQRILQVVRDAGVPIFAKQGFEAMMCGSGDVVTGWMNKLRSAIVSRVAFGP